MLPAEASTANPVDMIASADADRYRPCSRSSSAIPGVDGIIAIFVSPIMIDAYEVARAIADAADGKKPMLSVFMGKQRSGEGLALLAQKKVPGLPLSRRGGLGDVGAGALPAAARRSAREGGPLQGRSAPGLPGRSARPGRDGRADLSPNEAREVLLAYGFPLASSITVTTAAEAIAAAQEIGYPVVLKVSSERISHKTDVGGVKVDLRNADEVGQTFRDLLGRLKRRDPDLRVEVQKMVRGGREVILGMTRDGQFGPLLMFGLGGVFVEVMRDVSVRIHPLTDVGARRMIERVKGYPLLAGARGEKPVALDLVEECLLRLSQMVSDFEDDLAELDLNPFIVTAAPEDSYVVDARITLRTDRG